MSSLTRNHAADWLKKSFTAFTGEKVLFLSRNAIYVFHGYGFSRPLRYKFVVETNTWKLLSRGYVPRSEKSYLTEATSFREELK
jgi:hypothetical protein